MLQNAKGEIATIEDVVDHLMSLDEGIEDVVIIRTKKQNGDDLIEFTGAAQPQEGQEEFGVIPKFKLIGILEQAKDFAKQFSPQQDLVDHVVDELDLQMNPDLVSQGIQVGEVIKVPSNVAEQIASMKAQIQDRGLEIAEPEEEKEVGPNAD